MGAHLVNSATGTRTEVFYWRERNREVDFVLRRGRTVVAIEVASGWRKDALPGLDAFARAHRCERKLLVGGQGIPLDELLVAPAEEWL